MKKLPIKMLKGDKIILQPFSSKFISKEYLFWINDKDIAKFIDKAKDTTAIQELNSFAINMINSNYDYFFAYENLYKVCINKKHYSEASGLKLLSPQGKSLFINICVNKIIIH